MEAKVAHTTVNSTREEGEGGGWAGDEGWMEDAFSLTLGLHRGQSPSSLQVKELIMDQVLPVGDHNPW